jgi:hypothetical protein
LGFNPRGKIQFCQSEDLELVGDLKFEMANDCFVLKVDPGTFQNLEQKKLFHSRPDLPGNDALRRDNVNNPLGTIHLD